jgi:hypothetical protein
MRGRDEKPKVENKKNWTKIRWRERERMRKEKVFPPLQIEVELTECWSTACYRFLMPYIKEPRDFISETAAATLCTTRGKGKVPVLN